MLGPFVGAAVLGLIIAAMEDWVFQGWIPMIGCVLASWVPATLVNNLLPPAYFLVGLAAGAVCAAFPIVATCRMGLQRAVIVAGLYFVIQAAFSLGFKYLLA